MTLDITKCQIFYCAIEWLGVGTVEVGFVINGQFIPVHRFNHANITQSTYMSTAALPVRYKVESSALYSSSSTYLQQVCSTVISEGGYTPNSTKHYATLNINTTPTVSTTLIPIISIRLRSDRLNTLVIPAQADLIPLGNATLQYQLVYDGTLTGGTWTDVGGTSVCQYNTGATAISGGNVIDFGFVGSSNQSKSSVAVNGAENFNIQIGRTLSGTSKVLSLCAVAFSGSTTVGAGIGWYEVQ